MKHTAIILLLCCCLIVTTFAGSKENKSKDSKEHKDKGSKGSKEGGHSGGKGHSGSGSKESGSGSKESGGGSKESGSGSKESGSGSKESGGGSKDSGSGSNESGGDSKGSGGGGSGGGSSGKHSVSLKFTASSTYCYTYNEKSQTVIYNDYENKLAVFYVGQSGEAYIFSFQEGRAVYISGGLTKNTWNVKNKKFEEYFKKVYSTKELYEFGLKRGYAFNGDTVDKKVLVKLKQVLVTQSREYSHTCNAYNHAILTSRHIVKYPIKGAENYFGSLQNVQLKGDAYWIRGFFQGWKYFLRDFDGEFDAFKKANVKLDAKKLLQTESGDEVYIEVLRAISSKSNLVKVVAKRSNNQIGFFGSIAGFSGKGASGYRGFLVVVQHYLLYANGDISSSTFRYHLTEHLMSRSEVQINYEEKWETTIKRMVQTIKVELKLEREFGGILQILEKIQKKQWTLNEVNLYEGVTAICKEKRPSNKESIKKLWGKLKKRGDKDSNECD